MAKTKLSTMSLTEPHCINCSNTNCFILRHSSKEMLLSVNERKNFFKRKSGQAIIHAGMPLTSLFLVYQGKLKVVAEGLFGKHQIKRLVKAGDIIGFRELEGDHICPSCVYPIEDSLICSIELEFFIELLKANTNMMFETLLLLTKELRKSEWIMKNLTLMHVREKISHSLLYMNEVFGTVAGGEINVKLSRQEIGEIACTSKEEVSRVLSDFEEEGIIKTKGKKIFLLNLQELKNIIGIINKDIIFT